MKKGARFPFFVWFLLFLLVSGCQFSGEEPTTGAMVKMTKAMTPSLDPTDSPTIELSITPALQPTESPLATETATLEPTEPLLPTDTPTPQPAETPKPTKTPLPTKTPKPTSTPMPKPTEAPTVAPSQASTSIPKPDSDVPPPTQESDSPETPEIMDSITVFYISNPNDILGTFPVEAFDANALTNNMVQIRNSLEMMRGALGGARQGDAAACAAYIQAYNNILYSGVFYDQVPPAWQEVDEIYFISFIYSLDRTRPAFLSCQNAGNVDQFNGDLAAIAIEETLNILNQGIARASGML